MRSLHAAGWIFGIAVWLACSSSEHGDRAEARETARAAFAEARAGVSRASGSVSDLPPGPDTRVDRAQLQGDLEQLEQELSEVARHLAKDRLAEATAGAHRVQAEAQAIVSDVQRAAAARPGAARPESS